MEHNPFLRSASAGGALEAIFAAGVDDLPGVVEALNRAALRDRAGHPWTEASFQAEIRRLGA